MDKDLSDHGAVPYDTSISGDVRDLPDVDLSDHGAVPYDTSISGLSRDLPDVDLSDHGAVAYDTGLHGLSRDLPDVDLSDHGAVPYASKKETWGTNDEEIIEQLNILMHAYYYEKFDQVVPLLNADSLAKLVDYRYRQIANILDYSRNGLGKEDKQRIGTDIYMDLLIIENMIQTNPNCLQQIFNPDIYMGQNGLTDIFGVIEQYQRDLENVGVAIPLINGSTEQALVDQTGKAVTAQDILGYLMTKKELYQPEEPGGMTL